MQEKFVKPEVPDLAEEKSIGILHGWADEDWKSDQR